MAGTVILGDQATKWLAVRQLGPDATDHRVELLGRVLAFQYLENTGAAFGVLDGQGAFLTIVAGVVVTLLLGYHLRTNPSSSSLILSVSLLVGGAIGNVIDRIRLGYVVDFVAVGIWPKFNLADSAVTVGVILLGWAMMRDPSKADTGHPAAERSDDGETRDGHRLELVKADGNERG